MKQFYFITLLTLLITVFAHAQVSEQEFQALKALYNSTDGDNWTKRTGWENINTTATKDDVSADWWGIGEVKDGHVRIFYLGSNNLHGYIPKELGAFEYLTLLNLSRNKISGTIPSEIGNLTRLQELNLERNSLEGPLPLELKDMSELNKVYLSINNLNSEFPKQLPPNLRYLEMSYCGIAGTLPDIFKQMKLVTLALNGNELAGVIPQSISELKELQHLNLYNNLFSGELPTLGSCENLRTISVYNNNFTGTIPESYGNFLNLDKFEIYGNKLHGEVPVALAENVEFIKLKNNYFTFQAVEPILSSFLYANDYTPQKEVPLSQNTLDVDYGTQLALDASALALHDLGGNNNRYLWYFNGEEVYSGNSPVYTVAEADVSNAGEYYFKVTNTVVTELTLASEKMTVSIIGGNEAPTDISLSASSVDENFTGVVGTLSATDNNPDDTFTFSLVSGDGSNDKHNSQFSIDGSNLKASTTIDYETIPSCFIRISVNDGNGGIYTKDFELAVNNVDEAPVWDMDASTVSIDETAPDGSDVFTLIAIDPEASTPIFSISNGDSNGAFKITGNKLQVADNTKLDYDVKKQHVLTVVASDGNLNEDIELTINLNKINLPPEADDQQFDVFENSMAGTVVGILLASDPDDETLSYTLTGTDSEPFELNGDTLKVKDGAELDYETQQKYEFLSVVSDGVSKVEFTVTVNLKDLDDEITALNNAEKCSVKIYTNPVKNTLNICPLVQTNRIRIISLSGQLVLETAPLSTSVNINVARLKAGVYILEIQTGNISYSQKIVKL